MGNSELDRSSADPGDTGPQIDLVGALRLMVSAEPSAAPIGGSVRATTMDRSHTK
jgi:hypothetical protein